MRYLIMVPILCVLTMSCRQNDVKQKEVGSMERTGTTKSNISSRNITLQTNSAEKIKEIRSEYTRINALQLTKKSFKWEVDGCVDGGVVNYFFNGDKILKIVETGSIGDGSWVTEYYYKDDKFIFGYDVLTGGPADGPEIKKELRTYVKNDTIVQSIADKTIIHPKETVLTAASKEYKILRAYQTKDFEGALCR